MLAAALEADENAIVHADPLKQKRRFSNLVVVQSMQGGSGVLIDLNPNGTFSRVTG